MDTEGRTALMLASLRCYKLVILTGFNFYMILFSFDPVRLLVSLGASLSITDKQQNTGNHIVIIIIIYYAVISSSSRC